MARKGARVLGEEPSTSGRAPQRRLASFPQDSRRNLPAEQGEWRDEGPEEPRGAGGGGRRRQTSTAGTRLALPAEVTEELAAVAGASGGARLAGRLEMAARAYARDRYPEALRVTKALVADAPGSASARELHGLVCYRLGRYREALSHLQAAQALSGDDPSQLPVLMDCHRALGHRRRVADLWDELRSSSPDADVLAEGRLVMAAELADEGDLGGATELLLAAGAARNLRHPAERHVRQWYVLADLSERAGNLPRARELFARVAEVDPDLADASARLAALGLAPAARRHGRQPPTEHRPARPRPNRPRPGGQGRPRSAR